MCTKVWNRKIDQAAVGETVLEMRLARLEYPGTH